MNDTWIIIGNASGDVDYGIDESYYIFGLYPTEEEARSAMQSLAVSEDDVKVSADEGGCYLIENYCGLITCNTKEKLGEHDRILKNRDLRYYATHFTGLPMRCGGGWYLE